MIESITLFFFRYKVLMDLMRPHFGKLHHVTIDSWFTSPKLLHDLRNRHWNCHYYAEGNAIKFVKSQGPLMAVLYSDRRHVTVSSTTGSSRYMYIYKHVLISHNVTRYCAWNAIKCKCILVIAHDYMLWRLNNFL